MNIKMIVLDLDKTLLRSDKTISDYTISTLNECKKNGIKIAIASARPKRAVKIFSEQIGCDDIICLNGAMITIDDKIIDTNKISKDIAFDLIQKIIKKFPDLKLSAETNDYIHANFDLNEIFSNAENVVRTDFKELSTDIDKIILGIEDDTEISEIESLLPDTLYAKIANKYLLQIMSYAATKLNGVKTLAKYYNINLEDIAAFGDDNDDVEMIKYCGYGVAMANAIDDALKAAKYIAKSSDEDGVAKWIECNML